METTGISYESSVPFQSAGPITHYNSDKGHTDITESSEIYCLIIKTL
jgi:hypothetical protein